MSQLNSKGIQRSGEALQKGRDKWRGFRGEDIIAALLSNLNALPVEVLERRRDQRAGTGWGNRGSP